MYKSPIEVKLSDLFSNAAKKTNEYIIECVQQIGINVNKDELIKALEYDRGQYEKGWSDRNNEIVHCEDCKYLSITNRTPVYGCCSKNNHIFYLWEEDAREHYCSWGEKIKNEID